MITIDEEGMAAVLEETFEYMYQPGKLDVAALGSEVQELHQVQCAAWSEGLPCCLQDEAVRKAFIASVLERLT